VALLDLTNIEPQTKVYKSLSIFSSTWSRKSFNSFFYSSIVLTGTL